MCNALRAAHFVHCSSSCSLRSLLFELLTPPWNHLEQPQASGTREALWNGPPLTRGVRGVLFFCRVVRLLERAEEGCEGLKHGCYDLPCVYFLIFLCHDIKNKISQRAMPY